MLKTKEKQITLSVSFGQALRVVDAINIHRSELLRNAAACESKFAGPDGPTLAKACRAEVESLERFRDQLRDAFRIPPSIGLA